MAVAQQTRPASPHHTEHHDVPHQTRTPSRGQQPSQSRSEAIQGGLNSFSSRYGSITAPLSMGMGLVFPLMKMGGDKLSGSRFGFLQSLGYWLGSPQRGMDAQLREAIPSAMLDRLSKGGTRKGFESASANIAVHEGNAASQLGRLWNNYTPSVADRIQTTGGRIHEKLPGFLQRRFGRAGLEELTATARKSVSGLGTHFADVEKYLDAEQKGVAQTALGSLKGAFNGGSLGERIDTVQKAGGTMGGLMETLTQRLNPKHASYLKDEKERTALAKSLEGMQEHFVNIDAGTRPERYSDKLRNAGELMPRMRVSEVAGKTMNVVGTSLMVANTAFSMKDRVKALQDMEEDLTDKRPNPFNALWGKVSPEVRKARGQVWMEYGPQFAADFAVGAINSKLMQKGRVGMGIAMFGVPMVTGQVMNYFSERSQLLPTYAALRNHVKQGGKLDADAFVTLMVTASPLAARVGRGPLLNQIGKDMVDKNLDLGQALRIIQNEGQFRQVANQANATLGAEAALAQQAKMQAQMPAQEQVAGDKPIVGDGRWTGAEAARNKATQQVGVPARG